MTDFGFLTPDFRPSDDSSLKLYMSILVPQNLSQGPPPQIGLAVLGTLGGRFRLYPPINKTTFKRPELGVNSATCRVTITGIKSNGIPGRSYQN
jgi:hypothetical protein